MSKPPFKTALGISTGDIVSTSYRTGPYEVWDIHPLDRGLISLELIAPGAPRPHRRESHVWLNTIRRDGDRWFNQHDDEIFVTPMHEPQQAGLFTGETA
jgi:hypothetical protein